MRLIATIFLSIILGGIFMEVSAKKIKPEVFKISNGLEVWHVERDTLPFVVFKFVLPAGALLDPVEKRGLSYVTSRMLLEGTKKFSATAIAEKLEYMGADYSVGTSRDYATIYLRVTNKYLDEAFGIVASIIKEPLFDKDSFERVKKEIVSEIMRSEEDPGYVAMETFKRKLYGINHPYGGPVIGTKETIASIKIDDVVEFWRRYYVPKGSKLIVVGKIKRAKVEELLEKFLFDWKGEFKANPVEPTPVENKGRVFVEKNVTQANVIIGHVGVRRSNPDFVKLIVANQVLGGGGLTSRLFDRIREKGGYAYSVYSTIDAAYYSGTFRVVFQTENRRVEEAIKEVLDTLKDYVEKGPTEEELKLAKNYLTGSFPLRIDTSVKLADYLAFAAFYNLGIDYIERFPKEIESVTLDEVKDVLKRYFDLEKLLMVVVGKSEAQ